MTRLSLHDEVDVFQLIITRRARDNERERKIEKEQNKRPANAHIRCTEGENYAQTEGNIYCEIYHFFCTGFMLYNCHECIYAKSYITIIFYLKFEQILFYCGIKATVLIVVYSST